MSNTEKKILIFLVCAFIIGNIVLFIKKSRMRNDFRRFKVEELTVKIPINRASQEELELLPGVGPILARRIIEYRKENGKFREISDLLKVKGITSTLLLQIENFVVCD